MAEPDHATGLQVLGLSAAEEAAYELLIERPDAAGPAPTTGGWFALMLSGLTDQAIAHQLGLGHRTVQRWIADLIDELGARTRFQAGVQAAFRDLQDAERR